MVSTLPKDGFLGYTNTNERVLLPCYFPDGSNTQPIPLNGQGTCHSTEFYHNGLDHVGLLR